MLYDIGKAQQITDHVEEGDGKDLRKLRSTALGRREVLPKVRRGAKT